MDLYREQILDHYKNPRNFGHLKNPDVVMKEDNVTCGDKIIMELNVKNEEVVAIAFSGEGCAISQASASMLTEKTKGMSKKEIMKLTLKDITKMLGTTLTPSRVKCATLSLEVLQKAVAHHGHK